MMGRLPMIGRLPAIRTLATIGIRQSREKDKVVDEAKLIERAASGDRDAYALLVERYQRRLFVTAYEVLRNREDAEDVVQEALTKSFFALSSFRGGSSLASWLHRIALNIAIDRKRRVKRQGGETLQFDEQMGSGSLSDSRDISLSNPEMLLRKKEQSERVRAVLDELSDEHRQAIILREFDGLSYEQIAHICGVSVGTVMSRLFYARKRLQTVLSEVR
jgi:RNA polymerase sigma-70 factor (ECF subfamily)